MYSQSIRALQVIQAKRNEINSKVLINYSEWVFLIKLTYDLPESILLLSELVIDYF